jgi:uncharacterized OsmC-like protein
MSKEQPSKKWSISAALDGASAPIYSKGDLEVAPLGPAPLSLSPVEYLLLAASGCLALSIKAAAERLNQPFTSVRVVACGEKATGFPSRLKHIDVEASFATALPSSEANRVLEDAKRLCTVTNTLAGAPPIRVWLREDEAQRG